MSHLDVVPDVEVYGQSPRQTLIICKTISALLLYVEDNLFHAPFFRPLSNDTSNESTIPYTTFIVLPFFLSCREHVTRWR